MHWGSFFKGSFLAVFLLFLGLTGASLAYQVNTERVIAQANSAPTDSSNVYVAAAKPDIHFPEVLAAEAPPRQFHDVSVLLLGLDARKGVKSSRCDAIHTVSFLPARGKIKITSVPRGTISKDGNIIANVCSIYGYELAKQEIEKITGVAPDYTVKIGFSQTMGAFRLLGLPPSPTLQFLRDRKDYGIGDNQRSFNQGVFLKDMLTQRLDQINSLPEPVKRLGFQMLDSDISYATASQLLTEIIASGIYKDPENIEVVIMPKDNLVRQEIHLDQNVATDWSFETDTEYQDYQKELTAYLENLIAGKDLTTIQTVVNQHLWLQLDDPELRSQFEQELTNLVP